MIEVTIDEYTIKMARQKSKEMGKLSNSITFGEGNLAGFLGEFLVAEYIGAEINNTYEYDLLANGKKIDVKTKRCTSAPKEFYDCSVAAFNTKQKCDLYVFTRILWLKQQPKVWNKGWLLGWLPKEEYFHKARHLTKGEVDHSNGFVVKADCYNLRINQLRNMEGIANVM